METIGQKQKICFNCKSFQNGLARCYTPPKKREPSSICDNNLAYTPERFASTRNKTNSQPL